jgi:DNA-binding GntR family transcriptional regulator
VAGAASSAQGGGRAAAELAYGALAGMIEARRLRPEDVLSERRLAATLGLSRTPLREALRRLEGEGMLQRRADGTLCVPRLDVEDMLEVLAVRALLEPEAAAAAAGRIPAELLGHLRRRVAALAEAGDDTGAERAALDQALHEAIGEACGNRALAATIRDLRRRTLFFATRKVPERLASVCAEHMAILAGLSAGDAAATRAAMAGHIEATRAGILRRLGASGAGRA